MYIEFVNIVSVFCTYLYYISTFLILLTSASALSLIVTDLCCSSYMQDT